MTKLEAIRQFDIANDDVDAAVTAMRQLLEWQGYVCDYEMTRDERKRYVAAARTFYAVAKPLVTKYIDGE